MGVRAGQLRHRVTIESYNSGGRDENGFETPATWTEYSKLWAKVTPLSSKDLISAQGEQSEVTARMMVRYNTDIDTGEKQSAIEATKTGRFATLSQQSNKIQ